MVKHICPNCGGSNPANARFCGGCGTELTTVVGRRRLRGLVIIFLIAVLLLFSGVAFFAFNGWRPGSVFETPSAEQVQDSEQETAAALTKTLAATSTETASVSDPPTALPTTFTKTPLVPVKTPPPSKTPSPSKTSTSTPTFTATLTPTATATPTVSPSPAPPSGSIVFTCFINGFDEICRTNADGSDERRLTTDLATDFYASVSPDGRQIIFSSRRSGGFEMYLMDIDGRNQRRLSPNLGNVFAPAISPDGRRIVFTAARGSKQDIWVMNVDGSQATQLTTTGDNLDPIWSPDSAQIAFASSRDDTMAHFIMNVDGSGVRKLEFGITDVGGRSDWSPDGRWLVFYAGPRLSHDIYLGSINSSEVRRLTESSDNLAPSFSPDGNWIVFTSYRDGDAELFIMRVDGTNVTQLTFNDRPDWQPRWGP